MLETLVAIVVDAVDARVAVAAIVVLVLVAAAVLPGVAALAAHARAPCSLEQSHSELGSWSSSRTCRDQWWNHPHWSFRVVPIYVWTFCICPVLSREHSISMYPIATLSVKPLVVAVAAFSAW